LECSLNVVNLNLDLPVDWAENRHVIDGKFQPELIKERLKLYFCLFDLTCNHSLTEVK
jgi:hypothetical protein